MMKRNVTLDGSDPLALFFTQGLPGSSEWFRWKKYQSESHTGQRRRRWNRGQIYFEFKHVDEFIDPDNVHSAQRTR